jgi:propanol-preferring alcohol dehydrogenase
MKAMLTYGPGKPLTLAEVPEPKPGPNDVLVQVRTCGVGLTVVKTLLNPGRVASYPRIPGHEVAGIVAAVGSAVARVRVGQRVTNHYYLTCGQCRYCRSGRETLCENLRGNVGVVCDGGYAEYMVLPERNIIPIPDGVSDIDAAITSDAIATPYHACHKEARIGPGDDVLIIGAGGGVGIHMVQMARLCGGRVFAAEVGDEKLALAKRWGAEALIDARTQDIVEAARALTGGRGVDAVIDMVGTRQTLEAAMQTLATGGRMVIIGSRPKGIYGEDSSFLVDPISFQNRGLELHSSRYVNSSEIERTLELVRQKRITPVVTRTLALEQAQEAHDLIRNNQTAGRIALVVRS